MGASGENSNLESYSLESDQVNWEGSKMLNAPSTLG
jgi:hypothetical protein